MATFVLVHGMWHGAWSFGRLQARLEANGHRVIAADLASCGSDPTPPPEVTLDRWVDDTVALIEGAATRVVLVGHSRGGIVVSQTAEATPEAVAVSVYLAAMMLPNGKSGFQVPELMAEDGIAGGFDSPVVPRFAEDGSAMLAPADAEQSLYGSVGEEDRAWAMPQMGTEPFGPVATPLALTEARYGRVPRVYIATTLDRVVPIAAQQAMIARSQPVEVVMLEADHMPTITHVEELATILEDVAERYAAAGAGVRAGT